MTKGLLFVKLIDKMIFIDFNYTVTKVTLTELRYLIALDKEKNFSKAAQACFVSQPTLSNGIKKLEESLGLILFERGYHEIQTTFSGQEIVKRAQNVLNEIQAIKQLARNLQDPFVEPLRLGVIYTLSSSILSNTILQLQKEQPKLQLIIQENYTHELNRALDNGALDAALIALPCILPNLQVAPVYEEPFVALLPAKDPLAYAKEISTHDLEKKKLVVLGKGHCLRDQIITLCPRCDWEKNDKDSLSIESGSLETIRHMVAMGLGISIFPALSSVLSHYDENYIVIKPFQDPTPTRTLALVWRKTDPRASIFTFVTRVMKDVLSTMGEELIGLSPARERVCTPPPRVEVESSEH